MCNCILYVGPFLVDIAYFSSIEKRSEGIFISSSSHEVGYSLFFRHRPKDHDTRREGPSEKIGDIFSSTSDGMTLYRKVKSSPLCIIQHEPFRAGGL